MRTILGFCVVALLLACGDDAPVSPSEGMAASEPAQAAPANTAAAPMNGRPEIDRVELEPRNPRPGEQVTARVDASDPDGDALQISYRWIVGGEVLDDTGPSIHVEGEGRDTLIEVTVIARDGKDESRPQSASARIGNNPPRVLQIVLEPLGEVTAGRDVMATPAATDADGDPIDYEYTWFVNDEQVDEDGPTLSADAYDRGDRIVLEVVANDGLEDGEPLRSAPIEVVNAAPKITSTPGAIGDDGIFRYAVTAEDPDGDRSFRYRLVSAPAGMAIDFADGEIFWEPGRDLAGDHPVEVEVSDRFGGKSTQSFALRLSYAVEQVEPAQTSPAAQSPATDADADTDADTDDPDDPDADS